MIKIDYDVSEKILKKVHENIYDIIDLFIESCKGSAEEGEEFLEEIFPKFYLRESKDKCIEILNCLMEYTMDRFQHELRPMEEYALYHLFNWWLDITDVEFDQFIEEQATSTSDDIYIAKHINDIEEYKSFMFYDYDFLQVPEFFNTFRSNPELVEEYFHVNLDDYLDLMPNDIKQRYMEYKHQVSKEMSEEKEIENLIIKMIYNALKLKENDPRRLQRTSETELSDDIHHIVQIKLIEYGVNITREMPSGFSKRKIGELDFYIYTIQDDILKVIAIGENKEWGNFRNQIKQLFGYLTNETKFGFTIVFNKTAHLKTVLEKKEADN